MISRRQFFRAASGLFALILVSATMLAAIPIPLGFFKPASSASESITLDTDVSDWITRVQGQGSDVTIAGTRTAVNDFVIGLKADGIWAKIGRLNIYAGDGLNALKAPLKAACGDATDTLVNFVSGDYSQSTGLTGDGSSKCVTTGLQFSSCGGIGVDNISFGAYVRTVTNTTDAIMGAYDDVTGVAADSLNAAHSGNTDYLVCNNAMGGLLLVTDTNGIGFYIGSRPAASTERLYRNTELLASGTAAGTQRPTQTLTVHALNYVGTNTFFSPRTLELYYVSEGLSATDVTNYVNRYSTLRTALGR